MKDFDQDPSTKRGSRLSQDFEFMFGGEKLRLRNGIHVQSTAIDRWRDVLSRMLVPEGEEPDGFKPVEDDEFLEVFQETMRAILLPGQEAAFERALVNDQAPVMIPDAFEVIFWAVGVVTGRPTDAPSPSSSGSTAPTTELDTPSSTDASSSPAVAGSDA